MQFINFQVLQVRMIPVLDVLFLLVMDPVLDVLYL